MSRISTTRSICTALALVAAAIVLTIGSPAQSQEQGHIPEGTWVFVGGAAEREALREAIEGVVERMSSVIRRMARSQLIERVTIAPSVEIGRDEGRTMLRHPPIPPRPVTTDGSPVTLWTRYGERARVGARANGLTILETITVPGTRRRNTYRLSPDGRRLAVHVDIRSSFLPAPLRYRLTYARQ